MHTKKYDLLFNWNITLACNLQCIYCNNRHYNDKVINLIQSTPVGRLLTNIVWKNFIINRSNALINKPEFDINKVLDIINRMGKIAKIRLLGGEPFLYKNFIELCSELTKNHYIDVESNFSTSSVKKFCDTIIPDRVEEIRAAFHINELEQRKLVNRYIDNFLYCKEKKFGITAIVVVYPAILKKIIKYREILFKEGINLMSHPFVGHYKGKEYPGSYTGYEIKALDMNLDGVSLMRNTKNQLCSAGNSFFVILPSGNVFPCYQMLDKKIGNINKEIDIVSPLIQCPFNKCFCDPRKMNGELYDFTISGLTKSGKYYSEINAGY